MSLPPFTAEVTLYKSRRHYRSSWPAGSVPGQWVQPSIRNETETCQRNADFLRIIPVGPGDPCYNVPNEQTCNGKYPEDVGCDQDAYTAVSRYIYPWGGVYDPTTPVGLVELRYSPHCGTNWSRVTSYIDSTEMNAAIKYDDCGGNFLYRNYQFQGPNQIWSPMIYAPVRNAAAWGDVASQHFGACASNSGF